MIKVNIHQVKTHFSEYLAQLEQGENIVICKRNVPIAEMRPIPHPGVEPRPLGLAKGAFKITDDFFKPLPDETIQAFRGKL